MIDRVSLKNQAKKDLKGKYETLVLAGLCLYAILIVFGVTLAVYMIKTDMAVGPGFWIAYFVCLAFDMMVLPIFSFALIRTVIQIKQTGEKASFNDFISNMGYVGKSLGVYWYKGLWITIWTIVGLLAILAPVAIIVLLNGFDENAALVLIVTSILEIALSVFMIYKQIQYSMAEYILAEDPERKVVASFKEGIKLTKGYKSNIFEMMISFIGWFILSVYTLGILFLWKMPYYVMSMYNLYEAIRDEKLRMSQSPAPDSQPAIDSNN
ncbi:MAG: DUF975 family protein [Treponema sp.]|nr:DUF975 family protein [Candidatus Treponema scatequi]